MLEKSTGDQWTLKKVQATNDNLTFEKGLVITAGADEPEATAPPVVEPTTPAPEQNPPGH